jgi:hypothetical protein
MTIARNSKGLVDALFDVIDKLNAKEIDSEHARAISHTARSIVNVAELELEYRKFTTDVHVPLSSLAIEAIESK